MNPQLLQQITSIATLLTAIAALMTILELRRQRTAGYRPTLGIDDQVISLYRPVSPDAGHTVVFHSIGNLPQRDARPDGDIRFRIRNVGAGAALEVHARWEFDAMEFARAVATVDPKAGKGIIVDSDFIQFQADGYASWMARRSQSHYLGTLPASHEDQGSDLRMPFSYALLTSAYFQAVLSKGIKKAIQFDLPPLTLSVTYRDRGGDTLESKYSVSLNLDFLSEGGGSIPECPGWCNIGRGAFHVRVA